MTAIANLVVPHLELLELCRRDFVGRINLLYSLVLEYSTRSHVADLSLFVSRLPLFYVSRCFLLREAVDLRKPTS